MPPCNHNLMAQFSCEELRERRQRADANIASDQRRSRQLEAALRYNEIQTANIRAEIDRLRNELSPPSLPGPRRRAKVGQRRPRRDRDRDAALEAGEALPQLFPNFRRIRDLEREIVQLEQERQRLLPQYARALRQLNEMLDGRGCIVVAMRRKGCLGY